MVKYCLFGLAMTMVATCSWSFVQQNNAPAVKILAPVNGVTVAAGNTLSYNIEVTDPEDGSSAYEEIAATEVYLKMKYLPSAKDIPAFLQKEAKGSKAFALIKQNNCFTCHAVQQKLTGPSFREIAVMYGATEKTYATLADKLINGSSGVWGDGPQMPAHPQLSKMDASAMAKLVVQYGNEKDFDILLGTEGFIKLKETGELNTNVLLLLASYLDHGVQLAGRKEGVAQAVVNLK